MSRNTPWVDGCCGPMLMIIVSPSSSSRPHAAAGEHELARLRRLGRRELLRALVGRARFESELDRGVCSSHRGDGSPLNVTGTRAGGKSLRSGWPSQSSGMRMRVRSGWPSKLMPKQVVRLALGEVRARIHRRERRHRRIVGRDFADHTDAPVARVRQEVGDDFEAFELDTRRRVARAVEQVVDRGDVDQHRELLFVAQVASRRRRTPRGRRRRRAGRGSRRRARRESARRAPPRPRRR